MNEWKIVKIMMQIEFNKHNEKGQICEVALLPNEQQKQAVGLLEFEIPENLKELIMSKINITEKK